MTAYAELTASPAVRPRPASPSVLESALATTTCPVRRAGLARVVAAADFRVAEIVITETEFGVQAQVSGEGRLLFEFID